MLLGFLGVIICWEIVWVENDVERKELFLFVKLKKKRFNKVESDVIYD